LGAAATLGVLAGLGAFTVGYGDGTAYLSNDPMACANCHVMQGHFDTWQKSSHRHVAVCNDCHLPPGFAGKWLTKADNGLLHSVAFTTGRFPDPLRIKPRNARRAQRACSKCHASIVHSLAAVGDRGDDPVCVQCHSDAGHALR
jgi:cytochrome c nitrite reductase small subunit